MSILHGSKVVVTGGAGFIGSHLVRALLARGVSAITVIDSLRYGDAKNLDVTKSSKSDSPVKIVRYTLGRDNPEELRSYLRGSDYLFHLAAEKHNQSKDSPAEVVRANVDGTLDLYLAAAEVGIKKLVYTSSLYAYGRMSGAPFVESEVPRPQTVYGVTKLTGEHLAEFVYKQFGLEYNVLRYLFVYGPKQFAGMGYKSVIVKNFERLLKDEDPVVFGDGKQTLDYVFVDDAVEATIQALETNLNGEVFNIGSGRGSPVAELVASMLKVSGSTRKIRYEAPDWTHGSCRVADATKARELLGWSSTVSMEEGLKRTFSWIKENQQI